MRNDAQPTHPLRLLAGIGEEEVDVLDGRGDEELVGVGELVDLLERAVLERDDEVGDELVAVVRLRVEQHVAEEEELRVSREGERERRCIPCERPCG